MFENNNVVSFFSGMLLVAGLGTINKDANILSNGLDVANVDTVAEC